MPTDFPELGFVALYLDRFIQETEGFVGLPGLQCGYRFVLLPVCRCVPLYLRDVFLVAVTVSLAGRQGRRLCPVRLDPGRRRRVAGEQAADKVLLVSACLLYTSDAADDTSEV